MRERFKRGLEDRGPVVEVRWSIAFGLSLLLIVPVAASVSTRPAHDAVLDLAPPAPADLPAVPREASVACPPWAMEPCDRLWRGEDGEVIAASPPGYVCEVPDHDATVRMENPAALTLAEGVEAPDLQGVARLDGGMLVVPWLSGSQAAEVESVWVGIAPVQTTGVVPGGEALCEATAGSAGFGAVVGAYEFYRGDTDPSDGWTIGVDMRLIPDGLHALVIRAFAGEPVPWLGPSEPVAHTVHLALVDTDADDTRTTPCSPTLAACTRMDLTPPWPAITPGDVSLSQVDGGQVTVAWGEDLEADESSVWIHAERWSLTGAEETYDDVDSLPVVTVLQDAWGPKLVLDPSQELAGGDTITVVSTDALGSTSTKRVVIR